MLRPGLYAELRKGDWRFIVGPPHIANSIEASQLSMRVGSQPLHIVPATRPAGDDGVGKIVAGVVLVGAMVVTAGLAAPAGAAFFGAAALSADVGVGIGVGAVGISYGTVAALGVSMALTGVASLLASHPSVQAQDTPTARAPAGDAPSFLFNGVVNNSQQGAPVPIVIGTHLVGSVVVSSGLNAEDM